MLWNRERIYQIYHAMLSMALTWALVLVINQYYVLRVPIVLSALFSLVPSILIYLFDMNRKNIISYLLLVSILPILALIFWIKQMSPLVWVEDLIGWCSSYNQTEELCIAQYANVIVFIAACIGAILLYIITKKQLAKVLLAILILATLIILSINKIDTNKVVVGISIFYIMTIIVELYGMINSQKTGKQEKREGILYLAPVCLILAVASTLLPSKPEPIQWNAVKNAYHSVKEQLEIWKTELDYYLGNANSEFTVNLTGYSEDGGELDKNSELIKDSKVAIKISGLDKNASVYLIGSVSDIYTGSSWEKSHLDYLPEEKDYLLDYSEMLFALSRQDLEVLQNNRFLNRRAIKLEYNNIKTKTFFYPNKMSRFDIFSGKQKINLEMPQISFAKAHGKGTSYQNIYYEMNLEGEAFIQMLRDADTFSYESSYRMDMDTAGWVQSNILIQDNVDDLLIREDFYEALVKRAAVIEQSYTTLPKELPDRVRDLAFEITEGYETKYDKLKAIEAYLLEYTYSLEAQTIPDNSDFTDYFLFESKEGYCTSFATSMAVLGRCLGIPTRYVEGYLAKLQTRDNELMYPVRNNQSHAWVEAYIEGVGWIPFEPTAPFYGNRYTEWLQPAKVKEGQSSGDNASYYYNIEEPELNQPEDYVPIAKKDHSGEVRSGVVIILSTIFVLLCIILIYYLILKHNYHKVFEKADQSGKMYMLFLRILRLLKREGFVLGDRETILMLSNRVKDRFRYERVTFAEVARIYMRYRYGEEEVTKKELDMVSMFQEGLQSKERNEDSWYKQWMEEFLFLVNPHSGLQKQSLYSNTPECPNR